MRRGVAIVTVVLVGFDVTIVGDGGAALASARGVREDHVARHRRMPTSADRRPPGLHSPGPHRG